MIKNNPFLAYHFLRRLHQIVIGRQHLVGNDLAKVDTPILHVAAGIVRFRLCRHGLTTARRPVQQVLLHLLPGRRLIAHVLAQQIVLQHLIVVGCCSTTTTTVRCTIVARSDRVLGFGFAKALSPLDRTRRVIISIVRVHLVPFVYFLLLLVVLLLLLLLLLLLPVVLRTDGSHRPGGQLLPVRNGRRLHQLLVDVLYQHGFRVLGRVLAAVPVEDGKQGNAAAVDVFTYHKSV